MWRRVGAQIGGPNAVTWWAWVITLPVSVLISSVYASPPTLTEVLQWTSALILIHVVLGVLMLLARVTVLPADRRRPRPLTAILFFALLGVVRALLLQLAQEKLGLSVFDLDERLAFNVVTLIAIYSAIAIVIDEFKADSIIVSNLLRAQESMSLLQEEERSSLQNLDAQILTNVESQVLQALEAQDVDSARVMDISNSLVRHLSQQLAEPEEHLGVNLPVEQTASARQAVTHVVQRMQVPSPLLTVMINLGLVFPTTVARLNFWLAIFTLLTGIPTFIGLWLMRRFIKLPANPLLRLAILLIGLAVTGVIAATISSWFWHTFLPADPSSVAAVASGVVVLGFLVSLWTAIVQGRAERRQALSATLNQQAQEVARVHSLVRERRIRAARFLHGTVQNALVAAAMRGEPAESIQQTITQLFGSYSAEDSGSDARASLENLLASWESVLAIQCTIDIGVWDELTPNPVRSAILIDLISEGLTNTVRHSIGRSIHIIVSLGGDSITVRMTSEGSATGSTTPGLGLRDLQARGVIIRLDLDHGSTTVTATL